MASREHVSVRLSPAGLAKIKEIQAKTGANRSQVIRTLLATALNDAEFAALVKSVEAKLMEQQ